MSAPRIGLLLALVSLLIGGVSQAAADEEYSLVYGLTLEPSGFDPHINQSSEIGIVLRQVYDTLVYRHPDTKEIVPGLASEWTISEDGLTYSFVLRQDVVFHDGTPFNAAAVAANLDRITNPETVSQRAVYMLGTYDHYEIVADYTINIVLSEPYAPLLDSLCQIYLGIASPTALSEYSNERYQYHQVGTGPFIFVEFVPGDRIVLRRNESYTWGPSFYTAPVENSVQEITYRFFTDPATRSLALESGEADIMGEIVPATARALTGNSNIQLLPTEIPGQPLHFFINTQNPPTDNALFRQALLYATNRSAIVDTVFQGFSPVAWGPLAANTLYYDRNLSDMYDYDVEQATALLTSIGYADADNNGYLDFAGGDLELTVLVPPWGLIPQVAQLIQDQWREVGIKATLEPTPGFAALLGAVGEGEYHLAAFNASGYDPALLNQYYLSNGASNFSRFSFAELDSALLAAVQAVDSNARFALYVQVQQYIMNQALILPIRDYVNLNATSTRVQGLTYDPYGWFPLLNNVTLAES